MTDNIQLDTPKFGDSNDDLILNNNNSESLLQSAQSKEISMKFIFKNEKEK